MKSPSTPVPRASSDPGGASPPRSAPPPRRPCAPFPPCGGRIVVTRPESASPRAEAKAVILLPAARADGSFDDSGAAASRRKSYEGAWMSTSLRRKETSSAAVRVPSARRCCRTLRILPHTGRSPRQTTLIPLHATDSVDHEAARRAIQTGRSRSEALLGPCPLTDRSERQTSAYASSPPGRLPVTASETGRRFVPSRTGAAVRATGTRLQLQPAASHPGAGAELALPDLNSSSAGHPATRTRGFAYPLLLAARLKTSVRTCSISRAVGGTLRLYGLDKSKPNTAGLLRARRLCRVAVR